MRVILRLRNRAGRTAFLVAVIAVCGALLYVAACDFLVGALADWRVPVTPDAPLASFLTAAFTGDGANPAVLGAALRYIPNSPRLHLKFAEFERGRPDTEDVSAAELHALRAINLSPHDYRPRLLLASIQDYKGDARAAENSLRSALQLAPHNVEAHYFLATLLLLRRDLDESLQEFRTAISGEPDYLSRALDVVWSETHENAQAVQAITSEQPKDRLALARFLLERARPMESASVFRHIDRTVLLNDRSAAQYIDSLISGGHVSLAYDLWRGLLGYSNESDEDGAPVVWNGGFESDILVDFSQFDWFIEPPKFATVSIDPGIAHTGKRSLRLDYLGHETTRLDNEVRQVLPLRRGAHYEVDYFVRTDNLTAPEGPRVAISAKGSSQWIAASDPAPEGSRDWQHIRFDFVASDDALLLGIIQKPKFSYEPPTRGSIWFDDFEIREIR